MLQVDDLPERANRILGKTHSQRINSLVSGIVQASWPASGLSDVPLEEKPVIGMDPEAREAMVELREFMFQRIYLPLGDSRQSEVGRDVVKLLYFHFVDNAEEIPPPYFGPGTDPERAAVDYVSGMTDRYAIRHAEKLQPGITQGAFHDGTLE